MINSYGHVLRVRDPATGEFKTIPALRGERGPQGGPLTIAYAWDPDPETGYTMEWQGATEDRHQQVYIGIATYDGSDDGLAALTKSDYKWFTLPSGKDGIDGDIGPKGDKGDKGVSGDSIRFAYAKEPYKREVINQNGSIEEYYNYEYSSIWEDGMTWLGLYKGNSEPSTKQDYTWIQLPKGESGDGPVKIKYAKSIVDKIETNRRLCYLAEYKPSEGYFFEDVSIMPASDFTDDSTKNERYVIINKAYGYTLMTHKPVYMAQDTTPNGLGYFLVTTEDDKYYRRVSKVPAEIGYFTDTGTFLSGPKTDAQRIPGAMTLKGEGNIYYYTDGITQRYYRKATVQGVTKYPILKRTVGPTFKRTNEYYSRNDINDSKPLLGGTYKIARYTALYTVNGFTGSPLVVKVDYGEIVGQKLIRYYLVDTKAITDKYSYIDMNNVDFNINTLIFQNDKVFELLDGDPDNEVYYIPTERTAEWLDADGHLWRQTDLMTTTNEGPIYKKETFVAGENAQYAIIYQSLESYEHMTYFDKYDQEADFMGIYIGTKNDIDTTDYQWIKIKGSTGRTGGPVHIRYAAEAKDTSGVAIVEKETISTVWQEGHTYIGIGVGENTLADEYGECNNSDSSIYNWIPLFKGIKGDKGDPGTAGKDGKPSALLFKFAPLPNIDDISDTRREGDLYVGICKDAHYDPVTNKVVTDNNTTENYLWLELPDSNYLSSYGAYLYAINNRTYVDVEELDLDSSAMVTKTKPIDMVVEDLYNMVINRVDTTDAVERNLESFRVASRKADNANVDKLNIAINYMRELLKRIRTLEAKHSISSSSESVELPYFDYSAVESANVPTNTSFSAHVKTNSNGRYDTYYISTLCTNDSTVWVKLKTGFDSILSSTDVYMFRVPLDPNEDIVRVQLSDTDYVASNGYYWYLLFKSKEENLLIQPMSPSVPENLYDYLIIERDKPTDA